MKRLLILLMACVATAALAATPALAGSSTGPKEVTANVYFEEGDCDSRPTIDVESQEGVVYTLNGEVLPKTEFEVPYGTSGTVIATAENGVNAVDGALTKTKDFFGSLASDKYGGELLPTVISMRELIESFDKKSGQLIAETRKMLGEVSASVNKSGQKFGEPPPRR